MQSVVDDGGEEKRAKGDAAKNEEGGVEDTDNEEGNHEEEAAWPPLELFLLEEAVVEGVKPGGDIVGARSEKFQEIENGPPDDRWGAFAAVVAGEEPIDEWQAIEVAEEGLEAVRGIAVDLLGGEGAFEVVET